MNNKKFYTVEIQYSAGPETKLFHIPNLDGVALRSLREGMFSTGVYRKINEDTGEILSPWNIQKVTVYRQAHFFKSADLEKPMAREQSNNSPKK